MGQDYRILADKYRDVLKPTLSKRYGRKKKPASKNTLWRVCTTGLVTFQTLAKLQPFFKKENLPELRWEELHRPPTAPVVRPPASRTRRQLGEELDILSRDVARRVRLESTSSEWWREVLEREARCDSLRSDALRSTQQDVAQAATILKGCCRIKSSFAGNFLGDDRDGSRKLLCELQEISRQPGTDAGLKNAALLTQARLLREQTLIAPDPHTRVSQFIHAAIIMSSVQGSMLPFPLPLPGLSNEMNRDALIWDDPGSYDAMTIKMPTPFRYKATCLKAAAYELFLATPNNRSMIDGFLKQASSNLTTGLLKAREGEQYWASLKGVEFETGAIRHIIETRHDGYAPQCNRSSGDVTKQLGELDKHIEALCDAILQPAAKRHYGMELQSCRAVLYGLRQEQTLQEKVLPDLRTSCREAPYTKSMHPQQSIYHHSFMRREDRRDSFLKDCLYRDDEIESYKMQMVGGGY